MKSWDPLEFKIRFKVTDLFSTHRLKTQKPQQLELVVDHIIHISVIYDLHIYGSM